MELKQLLTLYKKRGETPLQSLEAFRKEHPEYKDVKLSYLGRLDPMAEGLLLVAVGEENKNRDAYLGLNKEYEFEILFGFETDTYDLLGMATLKVPSIVSSSWRGEANGNVFRNNTGYLELMPVTIMQNLLPNFLGKQTQSYPPYSSRTIDGKPMWEIAREGKLGEVVVPTNEIEIFKLELLETREVSKEFLQTEIPSLIDLVKGDFRQEEIKKSWQSALASSSSDAFQIASLRISCSSGTYVRSLVHQIGQQLGSGAVAFSIKRTKLGWYDAKLTDM